MLCNGSLKYAKGPSLVCKRTDTLNSSRIFISLHLHNLKSSKICNYMFIFINATKEKKQRGKETQKKMVTYDRNCSKYINNYNECDQIELADEKTNIVR